MNILILYAEITGYLMACVRTLAQRPDVAQVLLYEGMNSGETDFRFASSGKISIRSAVGKTKANLMPEMEAFAPDIIFVSGWAFPVYLKIARHFKNKGCIVVGASDRQWYGTPRQRGGALLSYWMVRRYFDFMWVPGTYQYEFASRLGFPRDRIFTGLLSADIKPFREACKHQLPAKAGVYPRELVYLGRLSPEKGVTELYEAFRELDPAQTRGWRLTFVGSGPLRAQMQETEHIRFFDFVQPEDVPELLAGASAFVLPSRQDGWAVAVHEAVAAGLPVVVSNQAGAVASFVKDRYNGFLFNPGRKGDLTAKLLELFACTDEELREMGHRSAGLSRQFTPGIWAQTLVNMYRQGK